MNPPSNFGWLSFGQAPSSIVTNQSPNLGFQALLPDTIMLQLLVSHPWLPFFDLSFSSKLVAGVH